MEFKVGDKVAGNASNFFHRVGMFGEVESINEHGTWVTWADGETIEALKGGIDLVSRATPQEPAKPRKMHPDDFMLAVSEFAADNGFKLKYVTVETEYGVQSTFSGYEV